MTDETDPGPSWAEAWARRALQALDDDDTGTETTAIVLALLAIRSELHTANLIAAAANDEVPILHRTFGDAGAAGLGAEAKTLRATIRAELDVDGVNP